MGLEGLIAVIDLINFDIALENMLTEDKPKEE